MLQWGRDFSVAEMPTSCVARSAFNVLQWGRDFSVAEIFMVVESYANSLIASMGPRLFSRGNTATSDSNGLLSMLQWGRDFSVAEIAP